MHYSDSTHADDQVSEDTTVTNLLHVSNKFFFDFSLNNRLFCTSFRTPVAPFQLNETTSV
jgi:hypothetical protein